MSNDPYVGLKQNSESKIFEKKENDIQKSLDNIINGYVVEYNNLTGIDSDEKEILKKSNEYINFKNNKFYNNINELKRIESIINTKDKLIRENKDYHEAFRYKINMIGSFCLYIFFIIIGFFTYNSNKISFVTFILYTITLSIIALSYIVWGKNTGKGLRMLNKDLKITKSLKKIKKVFSNKVDEVKDVFKDNEVLDPRCICPPKEESLVDEELIDYAGEEDNTPIANNGIFYKDVSAPKQRIEPPGTGDPHEFKVKWQTNRQLGINRDAKYAAPSVLRWDDNGNIDKGYNGGLPLPQLEGHTTCDDKEPSKEYNEYERNTYTKTNNL